VARGDDRRASRAGRPGGDRSTGPVGPIAATILGTLGIALPQLATAQPHTALRWVLLWGGSLMGGGAVGLVGVLATDVFDRLLAGAGDRLARLRESVKIQNLVVGVVACVLGLGVGVGAPPAVAGVQRWLYGCPFPTELRVLTSPDGLSTASALASAYQRSTARDDGGCPQVSPFVYAAGADEVVADLRANWPLNALRDVGPRPDVWLPDAGWQVTQVQARPGMPGDSVPVVEDSPLAYSPMVLAVPITAVSTERGADRGSGPGGKLSADRAKADWAQLLDRILDNDQWALVRPDPMRSVAGAFVSVAMYRGAGAGRIDRLERRIDGSLDRGGYPLGDSTDVLCRLRNTAAEAAVPLRPTAVVTTEQAMVHFNQRLPLGSGCPVGGESLPGEPFLYAFYPTDTSSLDHRFVRFGWSDETSAQTRAAKEFGVWLRSGDGKRELVRAGLRPPEYPVGAPLTEQYGAFPGAIVADAPAANAVVSALETYADHHRPVRVLMALDASGSMGRPAGGRSGTRFQVAAQALSAALGRLRAGDEYGLWAFSNRFVPTGYRQLLAVQTRNAASSAAMTVALAGVAPEGQTPLYATIAAGVDQLSRSEERSSRALLVLTDGHDTGGSDGSAQTAAVRGKQVRVFVVAIGEANCAGTLAALAADTGGDCRPATLDTLDDALVRFFDTLRGGTAGGS
jgi:hypothetical protein